MEKYILTLFLSLSVSLWLAAQNDRYDILPVHEGGTIFVGDSITDDCEWNELFGSQDILNRGIDGNTSESVLQRIKEISRHQPAKVFFAIGTNDFPTRTPDQVLDNVRKCCDSIAADSPDTRIFIESVLPVGPKQMFFIDGQEAKNEWISELNRKYDSFCAERGYVFIDTHTLADVLRPYVGAEAVPLGICTLPDVEPDPGITDTDALISKAVLAGKVRRAMVFQIMPAHKQSILFAGGAIMEDCEWKEIFNDARIYNRGIDGASVEEFIAQVPELSRHDAEKIFIEIGSDEAVSDPGNGLEGTRRSISLASYQGKMREPSKNIMPAFQRFAMRQASYSLISMILSLSQMAVSILSMAGTTGNCLPRAIPIWQTVLGNICKSSYCSRSFKNPLALRNSQMRSR